MTVGTKLALLHKAVQKFITRKRTFPAAGKKLAVLRMVEVDALAIAVNMRPEYGIASRFAVRRGVEFDMVVLGIRPW
jgi:hypothetical protein